MPRRRGISEKSFYAFNPLPAITDAEVLKRAGLSDLMEPAKPLPFYVTWKYGGTLETETVRLPPQEMFVLRESECKEFAREFTEMGMVILEDPADADEVKAKTIAGLQKAQVYWNRTGAKRLIAIRKTHSYSKEDMEDLRGDHWSYHANQAKADIISDTLKSIRKASKE